MSNYVIKTNDNELYHYGVLGMKWGVHRANKQNASINKWKRKALSYDVKSAKKALKAEKIHNKLDLNKSNKLAVKAAKYDKKAAILRSDALKTNDYHDRLRLDKKAAKNAFKSSKIKVKTNSISKSKGYGSKALSVSKKSDILKKKAEKYRYKVQKAEFYKSTLKKKYNSLNGDKLESVNAYMKKKRIRCLT